MRFQEYLLEEGKLNLNSHVLYVWKGVRVLDTNHAVKRIRERNTLTDEEMELLFKEAVEKVLHKKAKVGENVEFWSKSLKQAFVGAVEKTRKDKDLVIITFYPRHKKPSGNLHPYDHKIILEGVTDES